MKKIGLVLFMVFGLVASMSAKTVFVEEVRVDDDDVNVLNFYSTEEGECRTFPKEEADTIEEDIKGMIDFLGQPTYIDVEDYSETDTFFFKENDFDYYFFWDETGKKTCHVYKMSETKVMYMWFPLKDLDEE